MILADDREDGEVLKLLCSTTTIPVTVKRLNCGDYVMDDTVIERKTIDDFCGSLVSGRLEEQVERMKKEFKHRYVLISGKIGDRASEINENCILGYISKLLVNGISVCILDNDKQLVFLMRRIFERQLEGGVK